MTVLQDLRGAGGRERRDERGPPADAAGACRCDRGRARSECVRSPAAAGTECPGRGPAGLPAGPQRNERACRRGAFGAWHSFVLATGMLAEQLPAPMLAGLLLVKPYLSADLSRALARAVGRTSVKA